MGEKFDGGFKIEAVKSTTGQDLNYKINWTMMRNRSRYTFSSRYDYGIQNQMVVQHQ